MFLDQFLSCDLYLRQYPLGNPNLSLSAVERKRQLLKLTKILWTCLLRDLIRWSVKRSQSLRWAKATSGYESNMILDPDILILDDSLSAGCQNWVCDHRQSMRRGRIRQPLLPSFSAVVHGLDLVLQNGHHWTGQARLASPECWYAQTYQSQQLENERRRRCRIRKNNGLYWSAWCPISSPMASLTLLALSFPWWRRSLKVSSLVWLHFIDPQYPAILINWPWPFCWSTMVFISCKLWFSICWNLSCAGVLQYCQRYFRRDAFANMENWHVLFWHKTPAGSIVFVWPMILRPSVICFQGFYPALSQQFLSFWQLCIPCYAGFSFDSF